MFGRKSKRQTNGAAIKKLKKPANVQKGTVRHFGRWKVKQGRQGGRFMLTNVKRAQLVLVVDVVYEPDWLTACLFGLFKSLRPQGSPHRSRRKIDACAFKSRVWQHFKLMKLYSEQADPERFLGWCNHPSAGVNCIIAECCFQIFNWKGVLSLLRLLLFVSPILLASLAISWLHAYPVTNPVSMLFCLLFNIIVIRFCQCPKGVGRMACT